MGITTTNFYTNIVESLSKSPGNLAIRWQDSDFDGNHILTQVELFRNLLSAQKVNKGDYILIANSFIPDTLFMIIAIMANGAIPVLPPAKTGPNVIFQVIKRMQIKWVYTDKITNPVYKLALRFFHIKVINLSKSSGGINNKISPPIVVPETQPALVTHSSGSTGIPKSISRSHAVLSAQHTVLNKLFPPHHLHNDFPLFPAIVLHNLSCGITTIIPDIPSFDLQRLDINKIVTQLHNQRITTLTGNVFYFKKLLEKEKELSTSVECVLAIGIGGSPVPEYILHDLKKVFYNATVYCIYGSSEAEPISIRKTEQRILSEKGFCVGSVVSSIAIKLESPEKIVSNNVKFMAGEILVKGEHVVVPEKEEWYRTGDFGYMDELNTLYLTGRKGNEKIIDKTQHYQIESVLVNIKGVTSAAALARDNFFEIYVVANNSEQAIRNELLKYFPQSCLGPIHFRESLPVDNRHLSKTIYSQVK